ncbi:MAG: hypothetical protein HZC47_06855 [Methanobacterium sp.]|uniref:DUF7847 domain-containing protein n=1 Tax=Methanobacterium sp. TaxID=2164 RepID=UPI003D64BB8F|nr:hypothetical protein [Methanobacterium sp.]
MDIGDYYSNSIEGFRKNPKLAVPVLVGYIGMYVIALILGLIVIVALFGMGSLSTGQFNINSMNYTSIGTLFVFYLAILVIIFVISCCIAAATIGMSKKIINGEKPELDAGLKSIKKYIIKIALVSIIFGLILVVFTLPVVAGIAVDYMYGLFPALTIIGGLVAVCLWIVTYILFMFTYQSIIVGKKSVIGSIKDSVKVLKKNLLEVIVVLVINAVILLGIGALMFFINMFLGLIPIVGAFIGLILSLIVNSLTYPYFTLVLTYLYMDKKDKITADSRYID